MIPAHAVNTQQWEEVEIGGHGKQSRHAVAPRGGHHVTPKQRYDENGDVVTRPAAKRLDVSARVNIQKARTAKNWKQVDLARAVGIPESRIKDFESGRLSPDPATLTKLQRALGVYLTGDKAMTPFGAAAKGRDKC